MNEKPNPDFLLLCKLIERWRRDAEQYQKQLLEAQVKGLECRHTEGMVGALRSCSAELEKAIRSHE